MEAGTHNHIRVYEPVEEPVEIGRVVLAIGINLNHGVIPLALGIEEGGAHGATHSYVEGQRDYCGSCAGRQRCRVISGSIIDDQDVSLGAMGADFGDDVSDRSALIPRRNGHKFAALCHVGQR
jgi:hypothetical protein